MRPDNVVAWLESPQGQKWARYHFRPLTILVSIVEDGNDDEGWPHPADWIWYARLASEDWECCVNDATG